MDITDDILVKKCLKVQKKNTKKNDKAVECQFREYLAPKDCDHTRFWGYDKATLNDHLSKFYFAVRQIKLDETTNKPKKYHVQSMKTMCYALNRVLQENGVNFDNMTDPALRKSHPAFSDCCKELKDEGFGFVKPTDEIVPTGTVNYTLHSLFFFQIRATKLQQSQ